MGWRPDELVGRNAFEFLRPEQHAWAAGMLQKIIGGDGSTERIEVEALHKNGSWRLLEYAIQNRLDDPAIGGIVVNYRDITERRRWEHALRESEERYQKAFMSSPDGIAISRLKDGVFLEVNPGFEEITGFSRAEMVGRSSLDLSHWKNPGDRERLARTLREKGWVRGFQAEFLDKQGDVHIGQLSAELVQLGGEPCMLAAIRDVTEEVAADERLKGISAELRVESDRLREKHRALSEILAGLQQDKSSYRHEMSSSVANLLRPLIDKMWASHGRLDREDVDLLEQRLDMIGGATIGGPREKLARLTRREREVCRLIGDGHSSREIAHRLGLSHETVNKHRQSIRRKLQIDHRGINLTSYLRSM
jgi:PAS domain S-box-containing protein